MTKSILLIITLIFFLIKPLLVNAAEVLQITNSSTLLIGDQNRNYTVKIACLKIDPSKEKSIISLLNDQLPKHSRINLKPKGSSNGVLISKVIKIGTNIDIGEMIISEGLATYDCQLP